MIPRQWKVIQTVREKFSCRNCETITQPPAPFHVTPRGFAGPNLLAMILFEKFGQHQPLNRQSERYRREGIDLSVSTLADQVGACTTVLQPLHALIEAHVLAAERLHGDDTTVPILAKGKTITGHIWTYVRDDRPFGGRAPPAALYYASRDRRHEHPVRHLRAFTGILQADAYSGYNGLYDPSRSPGAITSGAVLGHARRQFFELADIAANARRGKKAAAISPVALEAVKRIDALFDIERAINGLSAEERLRVRQEQSAPLLAALEAWLREERCSPVALGLRRQADRLHAQALGPVCPLPRRRPDLPHQQRGRAGAARICAGTQVVALRRFRTRRRPGRGHDHADHDGEAQRRRSAGLAGRRARPHRRHAAEPAC